MVAKKTQMCYLIISRTEQSTEIVHRQRQNTAIDQACWDFEEFVVFLGLIISDC